MTNAGQLIRPSRGEISARATPTLRLRILGVSLGLAGTGALVFALAPVVGMTMIEFLSAGSTALADVTWFMPEIAVKGAAIGFVTLPTAAWLLLRRVAIGRMLFAAGIGATIGAPIGAMLVPLSAFSSNVPGVIDGALVGFALATATLRVTVGRVVHPR